MRETRGSSRRHLRSDGRPPGPTLSQAKAKAMKKKATKSGSSKKDQKREVVTDEGKEDAEDGAARARGGEAAVSDELSDLEENSGTDEYPPSRSIKIVPTSDSISGSEPPRRPPSTRRSGDAGARFSLPPVPSVVIEKKIRVPAGRRRQIQLQSTDEHDHAPQPSVSKVHGLQTIDEEEEEETEEEPQQDELGRVEALQEDQEEGEEPEIEIEDEHAGTSDDEPMHEEHRRTIAADDMDVDDGPEDDESGSDYSQTKRVGFPGLGKRRNIQQDEDEDDDDLEDEVVPESPERIKRVQGRGQRSQKEKERPVPVNDEGDTSDLEHEGRQHAKAKKGKERSKPPKASRTALEQEAAADAGDKADDEGEDDDDDEGSDSDDEEEVDIVTGKPYTPGPLSERLGNEAIAIYQECMDKLDEIAHTANKPLHAILSHIHEVKPPSVRNTSPWNAYASWYNEEGEYEKPEDWPIQQWNKFVGTQYRKEVVAAVGEDKVGDAEAVREGMGFYIDWYKDRLVQHLDKVKSNPKKATRLLNRALKPILHTAKQIWEDQGILVWGAAHPTRHNNTSVGPGVMWSGSPLFARVKERSETQVSRALEDMTTLIHMVQMEGTEASAEVLDLYRELHFPAKKPPTNEVERDKHRRWLATIFRHDAQHILRKKTKIAIGNFVTHAFEHKLVLRNYPKDTSVPGVGSFTLHNLSAGSLRALVHNRVEYVNKSVSNTLKADDPCNNYLYLEPWSDADKEAKLIAQRKVAIVTDVEGTEVVLAEASQSYTDALARCGDDDQEEEGTQRTAAKVQRAKAAPRPPRPSKTLPLFQDEDEEEEQVQVPPPRAPTGSSRSRPNNAQPVPRKPTAGAASQPQEHDDDSSLPAPKVRAAPTPHPRQQIEEPISPRRPADAGASSHSRGDNRSSLPIPRTRPAASEPRNERNGERSFPLPRARPDPSSLTTEVVTKAKRPIVPASRVASHSEALRTRELHPGPEATVPQRKPPPAAQGARSLPSARSSTLQTALRGPPGSRHTSVEPVDRRGFTPDLSNIQSEMQQWQENEDRYWREQDQLHEAENRRVNALSPIRHGFSWDDQPDSCAEPPNKKRKYDDSDTQRPRKPLPIRARETPLVGNSPVAGPSGLQSRNVGPNPMNPNAGPASSRPRLSLSPSKYPPIDLADVLRPRQKRRPN
ncbi:hypothetical protein V5O48_010798 [Marasmius crinis-equi]|uniref:Uncharacterized protein n=1 Tax=Marasmius crinis-equi TaxID=585013 RepID=A0ABR3F7C4_9AGAR